MVDPTDTEKLKDKQVDNYIFLETEKSWEIEGQKLISKNKMKFTLDDKKELYYLFEKYTLPDKMREEYWLIATETKIAKKNYPNYYYNLLNFYPKNNKLNQISIFSYFPLNF